MSSWEDRVRSQMKMLGLTQEELAAKLGITRGAITHYLSGRRVPPLKQFKKLAETLKVDPAWLQYGRESTNNKSAQITESAIIQETFHRIPILTWQQAAKFKRGDKVKLTDIKEFIPHFHTEHKHWYGLRVHGDSMTAINARKQFSDGDIIVVDPLAKAANGCFVVAILPHANEVIFKEYVVDGGVSYLKPLNPQYPLIKIDKKTQVVGVVVAKQEIYDYQ